MSRWTNTNKNAYKFNKYISPKNLLFQVCTDQGTFTFSSPYRIDYKKTRENLIKKGYTNIDICYIGRTI